MVVLALFYALIIKKPEVADEEDNGLKKDEEYLHPVGSDAIQQDISARKANVPLPPDPEYLDQMRKTR